MFDWLFKKKPQTRLGIDFGNSIIKIVEVAKKEGRLNLVNYAMAQSKREGLRFSELKNEEVASVLKALMAEAKFSSRVANISLPVERTFSTVIDMPQMEEKEMAAAIPYEAQKYVPIPVDEVVLDWSLIPSGSGQQKSGETAEQRNMYSSVKPTVQLLLVAVPKDIIANLTKIAKLAGLEILALEQEAFSLSRSLVGNDANIFLIADFGSRCTDLIVVEQGLIRISHSAESLSKEIILMEIDRVVNLYQMKYNKKVNQCLLTGGRAAGKEVLEFLSGKLRIPVKIGNPLARIGHASVLDRASEELGLQLSVAIGLAMRE